MAITISHSRNEQAAMSLKPLSLSRYFPAHSVYFYGYPAGDGSNFINKVSPAIEELVAARAIGCSGTNVSVVAFDATTANQISSTLLRKFDIPQIDPETDMTLSPNVHVDLLGTARDDAICDELLDMVGEHTFVMAQPFLNERVEDLFQIPTAVTTWVNDKAHMREYVNPTMLPQTFGQFKSGNDCVEALENLKLPYVIKISASSSGDGVYICKTDADRDLARTELKDLNADVLIEQYIDSVKNYAVHFGIPVNKQQEIDIIGVNKQIIDDTGSFLGGIIDNEPLSNGLKTAIDHLRNSILPFVRQKGWYGIGGFDVLIDKFDNPFFIDCNFRMTGMSAYHFMVINNRLTAPLISFSGELHGSQKDFEAALMPLAGKHALHRCIQIISLNHHNDTWLFNAALHLDPNVSAKEQVALVLRSGVSSDGLSRISQFID